MTKLKDFFILVKKHGGIIDVFLLFISFVLLLFFILDTISGTREFGAISGGIAVGIIIFVSDRLNKKNITPNVPDENGQLTAKNPNELNSVKKDLTYKPSGFWFWYSWILILVNIPIFTYLLIANTEGWGGFFAILIGLALLSSLPGAIWVNLNPIRDVKQIVNTYVSVLLIPITLLQLIILFSILKGY